MINYNFQSADSSYYNVKKERIVSLIPQGRNKILDIGCGSGKLGEQLLRQGKATEVVGVEIYKPAAIEAAKIYSRVIEADIEAIELDYSEYFDYVVCGDVLEHLQDPWMLIERIHRWLCKNSLLIISIPNIRYFRILWALVVNGRWEYQVEGVLDKTHLRFFTRHSLVEMITKGKLDLVRCDLTIHGRKKQIFNRCTFGIFQDFLGSQFLAIARKPAHT